MELSRNNQKLLRSPEPKALENIEEIKKLIADQYSRYEKNDEIRRISKRLHPMFIEDMLHMPPKAGKNYLGLLMVLSLFRNDFPWIYDLGKELVDILKTASSAEKKREVVDAFRMMLEHSTGHPMIREIYGVRKDMMFLKELPFLLNRYLEDFIVAQ